MGVAGVFAVGHPAVVMHRSAKFQTHPNAVDLL